MAERPNGDKRNDRAMQILLKSTTQPHYNGNRISKFMAKTPNKPSLTCMDLILTTSQNSMIMKPNNIGCIFELEFSVFI